MLNILITYYSIVNGIDPSLAFQMARVESGMNPNAISRTQDGGLFQLNARAHKFHYDKWRFIPHTNMAIALHKLSGLKKKLPKTYILAYNMGEAGSKRIKHPEKQTYVRKMNIIWRH